MNLFQIISLVMLTIGLSVYAYVELMIIRHQKKMYGIPVDWENEL